VAALALLLPVAVKERFPDRPAFANGVCTSGLNGGAAIASLVAVPAADAFGGWRGALTLFSLAAAVVVGTFGLAAVPALLLVGACLPLTATRLRPA
jgi:MFS transporter, CP family, cyanate transporter